MAEKKKTTNKSKKNTKKTLIKDFPYALVCVIIFLILGFCFNLWHPGWIIFLTIPIFH